MAALNRMPAPSLTRLRGLGYAGTMSMLRIDDNTVRWSVDGRPATAAVALAALADRPLLLLLHGYGSFEGDLIGLAPQLPTSFVCASPRAPLTAPAPIEDGYAWWQLAFDPATGSVRHSTPPESFVGTPEHAAAEALLDWIDRVDATLRTAGAGASALGTIAALGFSQGGAMVTSLLRMRPERFLCGVNCSGFVAPGSFEGDAALAQLRPPMFWGRDVSDPVIDQQRIAALAAWAPVHTTLTERQYTGVGHGIARDEVDDIFVFLNSLLETI